MCRQKVLGEYLGGLFIPNGDFGLKLEKCLLLLGDGAAGKSVIADVVFGLLGRENVSAHNLQNLTDENGYYRATLGDKVLNYCTEINGKLQSDKFKQMVSGEPLSVRLPGKDPITLFQYAKLVFNCNTLPSQVEHSEGFFRRFLIIRFDEKIEPEERDVNLAKKIVNKELPGVLNWMLKGLARLLKQESFSHCDAIDQALDKYHHDTNSVQQFLEDECLVNGEGHTLGKTLYLEYRTHCRENGMFPFGKIQFNEQMKNLGVRYGREAGTGQTIAYVRLNTFSQNT